MKIEEQLQVVGSALATVRSTIRIQQILLSTLTTLETIEGRMSFEYNDGSCWCTELVGICEVCELQMVRSSIAEIRAELGVKDHG